MAENRTFLLCVDRLPQCSVVGSVCPALGVLVAQPLLAVRVLLLLLKDAGKSACATQTDALPSGSSVWRDGVHAGQTLLFGTHRLLANDFSIFYLSVPVPLYR